MTMSPGLPCRRPRTAVRLAQVANFAGPATGGLRVVMDEVGRGHVAGGGERLRIVPGPARATAAGEHGVQVTVPGPRLPGSGGGYHVLVRRAQVRADLAAFTPDLVEVHDQTSLAWVASWAAARGIPALLFAHERLDLVAARWAGLDPGRFQRPGQWWAHRLARAFPAVVCASQFAAAPFRAAGVTGVRHIPFGVDLDTFAPRPSRTGPWPSGAVRLVLASRLSPEKDPGAALATLGHLVAGGIPAHLAVLGDGPLAGGLRERAARDRLPVTFLGHLTDRAAVARVLAAAEVVLAPGPFETFGLSALEALACGTPVVAAASGATRELLVPGAGLTASSPAGMAHAVRALLTDPAASARARARAEEFSWPRAWAELAALRAALCQDSGEGRETRDGRRLSRSRG